MTKSILDGLRGGLDSVLALRDTLGVALAEVALVERRWSDANIGDGNATDTVKKMWPSPQIVDLSQDIRLMDGGSMRRGDLILKSISKNKYDRQTLLSCGTISPDRNNTATDSDKSNV